MRLWHYKLIPYLPRQQLLGQHRECAALRGLGWMKPHSIIDYIFNYKPILLFTYHLQVMKEMQKRGYTVDPKWFEPSYRGKRCNPYSNKYTKYKLYNYPEHNKTYLIECLENLKSKGINLYEQVKDELATID